MIKITDLKIPLDYDLKFLMFIAAERLGIDSGCIKRIDILKRAVNNKDIANIFFDMDISVCVSSDENEVLSFCGSKFISKQAVATYKIPYKKLNERPVVVGFGPAGMFAALILAEAGCKPIIIERGSDVDARTEKVELFWRTGVLDTQTNVQFGEGGAGAFSDGKLKTGFKNERKIKIIDELIDSGAPPEIKYLTKPHIGTDKLKSVVKNIREKIIGLGGEVHFNTELKSLIIKNGRVQGVRVSRNDKCHEFLTDNVVLAIGHSARDTLESLQKDGVVLEQKPFAVGVRIEHKQTLINRIKYGDFACHPALGAADYRMVVHLKNGRGVYTFCMCPGGTVVAAASEKDRLTTNGMSEYARDGRNANTALLVTVNNHDLGSDKPLAGLEYQRRIEEAAFVAGGGAYKAPVQRLEDFLIKRNTRAFGDVVPTYMPGTSFAETDSYLPEHITESLRQAIAEMGEWMPGFYNPDAILTGAETRSSSPVRITRGDSLEATGIKGLYPCGEGAGYAGGIISAAADGILCAERILS
ncbi:MAG: hypothetical protein CVU97_05160 [Firmicutes bacterium HGW-Firmicutes-21]|nr:MAG: hypothetical protein CVU97_05160 [Firmicutes bacterium HGW-Firmicutes-21]